MRIIHISDLHFGTEIDFTVNTALLRIKELSPDLIVITGDFTQRALHRQFRAAKQFLQKLNNFKILCVPGNHDISLHNLFERFFAPFEKYKKYISANLNPEFCNDEVAMLGILSPTPYRAKDGIITHEQFQYMKNFFANQPKEKLRIVVMHHNLIKPEWHKIIENAEEVIKNFADCHVQLILSGHLHDACVEIIERDFIKEKMYVMTAGTLISHRLRTQPNSFNLLEINKNQLELTIYELQGDEYKNLPTVYYPL